MQQNWLHLNSFFLLVIIELSKQIWLMGGAENSCKEIYNWYFFNCCDLVRGCGSRVLFTEVLSLNHLNFFFALTAPRRVEMKRINQVHPFTFKRWISKVDSPTLRPIQAMCFVHHVCQARLVIRDKQTPQHFSSSTSSIKNLTLWKLCNYGEIPLIQLPLYLIIFLC